MSIPTSTTHELKRDNSNRIHHAYSKSTGKADQTNVGYSQM